MTTFSVAKPSIDLRFPSYTDAVYTHTSTATKYYGSTIRRGTGSCYWQIDRKDGSRFCFPESMSSGNARAAAAVSISDRYGNTLTLTRDGSRNLTRIVSPSGRFIQFTYDANNRIAQATDNIGRTVSYQYAFGRRNALTSQTDPLLKGETYLYDAGHNLIKKTDRKGQVTQYAYDGLDRLTTVTYADASTVRMTYDQGNRITQIVDSANGAITRTYDSLDRITQQTTPKGSVAYTYYANGLRKTLTVSGQPILTYTYDAGNRLPIIDQAAGAANNNLARRISFIYDAANRRLQTNYANGIKRTNGYDNAGQLISIAYSKTDGTMTATCATPMIMAVAASKPAAV